MDCIFCQIAAGKIASTILYQDSGVVAFRDINPKAPVHVVIVPRKHIPSLAQLASDDAGLVAQMVAAAQQVAKTEGVSERGYRLVINCGAEGGQVVPHLHLHLLGGRRLSAKLG